jgi:ABC-type nitrate/sulfonate/bicarbonate transport system permease component
VTSKQRAAYGFAFFVLFVALWAWATFGGYVSKTFLANPLTMLQEGLELLTKHGFLFDIGMTIWRVVGGFVLAAIIAVPLGVLMGAYKPIEAFLEPFVSFARYLPASAFIPLLILWAGIGELQKLLVIFIGSVFQIILMIAVTSATQGATSLKRLHAGRRRQRHHPPRAAALVRPRDRGNPSARSGLGVDLRHRRRTHRFIVGHRPHDHRQPGSA